MKRTLPLMLLAGLLASGPLGAQNLARVNGIAIPSERADAMIRELVAQGRPDTPQLRDLVKDRLVTYELMMQEASKLGLAKQPDVAVQLDFARQNVMVRAFLQDYVRKNPVTDAEIKAEYDEQIKKAPHPASKEYLAHHILVKTEAEAKNVIVKLKGGAKFEVLAKQVSMDTSNKDQGGELTWAAPDAYVPEFSQALIALEKGHVGQKPVQTQYGWHVIRLDDVRDTPLPTLEQLRPRLQEVVQNRHVEKMLADLRSGAKIE